MLGTTTNLHPKALESLSFWHQLVEKQDLSELYKIAHKDAIFRSPTGHKPYKSDMAMCMALQTVATVFDSFEYDREFAGEDGQSIVLEFRASVGDKEIKGIDMIRFDDNGKITEFEVMIRPMSGLQALAEKMAAKIGGQISGFKG